MSTIEEADYERIWVLLDDDGKHFKPFLKERLFLSIYDSLRHRKTAVEDAKAITATIISKLVKNCHDGQIARSNLFDVVLNTLKPLDKAAYTHYEAYYLK